MDQREQLLEILTERLATRYDQKTCAAAQKCQHVRKIGLPVALITALAFGGQWQAGNAIEALADDQTTQYQPHDAPICPPPS